MYMRIYSKQNSYLQSMAMNWHHHNTNSECRSVNTPSGDQHRWFANTIHLYLYIYLYFHGVQ